MTQKEIGDVKHHICNDIKGVELLLCALEALIDDEWIDPTTQIPGLEHNFTLERAIKKCQESVCKINKFVQNLK